MEGPKPEDLKWNPIVHNGWTRIEHGEPNTSGWCLVFGRAANGTLGYDMAFHEVTKHGPVGFATMQPGFKVSHWMDLPHPPGSEDINESAMMDWLGSDDYKVYLVAVYIHEGYSIRESVMKCIAYHEDIKKG